MEPCQCRVSAQHAENHYRIDSQAFENIPSEPSQSKENMSTLNFFSKGRGKQARRNRGGIADGRSPVLRKHTSHSMTENFLRGMCGRTSLSWRPRRGISVALMRGLVHLGFPCGHLLRCSLLEPPRVTCVPSVPTGHGQGRGGVIASCG